MTRIIVVEDEDLIARFVERGLAKHGYAATVADNAKTAMSIARDEYFDLMILDLGLPDLDGTGVIRQLRAEGQVMPIIVLTAREGPEATVATLDLGADDYLTKPFAFDELLARIRVRLRNKGVPDSTVLEVGQLKLDVRTRRVSIGEKTVELTAREYALAETFMRNPDQVLSREQLLSQVWGYDFSPDSNIVDVYVRYLRSKLGSDMIETIRGIGYRLSAQPS